MCCRYSAHEVSPTQADRNHLEKHRLTFSNSSSTYHITFRMSLTSIPGFSDEVIRFLSTKSVKKSNGKGFSPPLYFACMECVGVVSGRARVVQLRTSPRNQGSGLVKNGHVIQFAAPVSWGAGGYEQGAHTDPGQRSRCNTVPKRTWRRRGQMNSPLWFVGLHAFMYGIIFLILDMHRFFL